MNRELIDQLISVHTLSQQKVAELLSVTPQMVSKLIKQGSLVPLKSIQGINVFAVEDVNEYIRQKGLSQIIVPKKIYGGGGSNQFKKEFAEMIDPDRVIAIYLYFYDEDAINDGFYTTDGIATKDKLMKLDVPTFIVKLDDLDDIYFIGGLCGYAGTGPCAAYDVLTNIMGVPSELAEELFHSRYIKYYREGNTWEFTNKYRNSDTGDDGMFDIQNRTGSRMYLFNSKFVRLSSQFDRHWIGMDYTEFLEKIAFFIPCPTDITIYSREEAVYSGHCTYSSGDGEVVYPVVIRDLSGREVWLDVKVNDDKAIGDQKTINEILDYLDIKYSDIDAEMKVPEWMRPFVVRKMKVRDKRKITFAANAEK